MAKDKKSSSGGASASAGRQKATQDTDPIPAKNVTFQTRPHEDVMRKEQEKEIFGRELSVDDYSLLVGAQDDSQLQVTINSKGKIQVDVKHPDISGQTRVIDKDADGNTYMYNDYFMAKRTAPPGFGTKVFTAQVQGARALGVKYIKTLAGGSKNESMNGYYTWPRLGYDGDVPGDYRIPPSIKSTMQSNTFQELYRTKAGREWWKEEGGWVDVKFDLNPKSVSSRVLEAYNEERKKRTG